KERKEALELELELLATSRLAVGSGAVASDCSSYGFARLMLSAKCPEGVRVGAARGLASYNLSWVAGRTPARLADRKLVHLIAMEPLRVSQETALARSNMHTVALNVLAAYGEGGVKPETIAQFLQAIGIFSIADRVK